MSISGKMSSFFLFFEPNKTKARLDETKHSRGVGRSYVVLYE